MAGEKMEIRKLHVSELNKLTELFSYNDEKEMILSCTNDIQNERIDIFGLFENGILSGELRAKYTSEDESFAARGRRAYLYAFRVRKNDQGKGYGTYLLESVLSLLKEKGYCEFTVGVEDDNERALHMYKKAGFTELLLRKTEEYQGDLYSYNLYLKR